jgi:hypothetical protein
MLLSFECLPSPLATRQADGRVWKCIIEIPELDYRSSKRQCEVQSTQLIAVREQRYRADVEKIQKIYIYHEIIFEGSQ